MVRGSLALATQPRLMCTAETARANATGDHHNSRPQHDILEVNEYLMSSLRASPIDKWFTGLAAPINRESIGVPSENLTIEAAVSKARAALDRWDQTVHDVSPSPLRALRLGNQHLTTRGFYFPHTETLIGRRTPRPFAHRTEFGQTSADASGALQGNF